MKTFFKDYLDLCKDSGNFYKKHWKGTLMLNAVIIAGEMVYIYRDKIVDAVKEKLPKKEKES